MVRKNYQLFFSIIALAGIAILITMIPQSYGQANVTEQQQDEQVASSSQQWPNVHENVLTNFNSNVTFPSIQGSAFIHPFAVVIGNCYIGQNVLVAPTAVCRGDEGTPLHVGAFSNIQDGVVLHGLITTIDGNNQDDRRFASNGDRLLGNDTRFDSGYSVYVGENTSLAHGVLIHGPAFVGNNTFVGMESLVFDAKLGNNVAVGVASTITGGVEVADDKFVPPGSVITTQEQADALPERVGSAYENINSGVVPTNEDLAAEYGKIGLEMQSASEREQVMEEGMLETSISP
jgi:carbonic anhydrase/acetyltransferase-like protein (isoleucine patch superfamily)